MKARDIHNVHDIIMIHTIADTSAHSNVLDCNHNYFGSMLVYYVAVYYCVVAMAVDRLLFLTRYCVVYYNYELL